MQLGWPERLGPTGRSWAGARTRMLSVVASRRGNTVANSEPIVRDRLYIGGEWVPSAGSGTIDVIDSTTEAVMGTIPEGSTKDVDQAVAAARSAFPAWAATPVEE